MQQNAELQTALAHAQHALQATTIALERAQERMTPTHPPSFKIPLPPFSGNQDLESWIAKIELASKAMNVGSAQLGPLTYLTALKGSALIFIDSHPEGQADWEVQKALLRAHFTDDTRGIAIRSKMRSLQLIGNNLEGYYQEYVGLASQLAPPMSKEELFYGFFFGLPPAARERVLQSKALTLDAALEITRRFYNEAVTAGNSHHTAVAMELDHLRRGRGQRGYRQRSSSRPRSSVNLLCFNCGKVGHMRAECHQYPRSGSGKGDGKGKGKGKGRGNDRHTEHWRGRSPSPSRSNGSGPRPQGTPVAHK